MRIHSRPVWSGFIVALTILLSSLSIAPPARAEPAIDPATVERFNYLSTNGNSNCSTAFMNSIATMPVTARGCKAPVAIQWISSATSGRSRA
jgi:hypothetical protein